MFKNKEYVLTIYREGSFTAAAEKLFVSQPSLSASVKRIEDKVGAPIFDRSTTPITLTEIGEEYVRHAVEIEEREGDFTRFLEDHTQLVSGRIKIGGSSFFSSFILSKMISDFKSRYPSISFDIVEDSTKNLMTKLHLSELDLVIDNSIVTDESIISEKYTTERLLLAVPKSLAINDRLTKYQITAEDVKTDAYLDTPGIELAEFKDEQFILLHQENDTGRRAEKLFKKHGIVPKVIFRLDQQITAYNVSCSGLGISFVSDSLVRYTGNTQDVVYYNIDDESAKRSIYLYRKRTRYISRACERFIEEYTKS